MQIFLYALLMLTYALFIHKVMKNLGKYIRSIVHLLSLAVYFYLLDLIFPGANTIRDTILGAFLLTILIHSSEVVYHKNLSKSMQTTFLKFLLYFFVPHETQWPQSNFEKSLNRKNGVKRVFRGLMKSITFLFLVLVNSRYPNLHQYFLYQAFFLFLVIYLGTAVLDLYSGLIMLFGVEAKEAFDMPFVSTSPYDFWNHRWNLIIRNAFRRFLFSPIVKKSNYFVATMFVFFFSGLIHEALVYSEHSTYKGYTTLFFVVHGLAQFGTHFINKRYRLFTNLSNPVAIWSS